MLGGALADEASAVDVDQDSRDFLRRRVLGGYGEFERRYYSDHKTIFERISFEFFWSWFYLFRGSVLEIFKG